MFRGKILEHAFYHFFSAEISVCVKPSLFIAGSSMALKIMKNSQWLTSVCVVHCKSFRCMAYVYGCGSVSVVFLFLGLKEVFFYISKCWKHL